MLASQIKSLTIDSKVFPFISLTLTLLIVMHVFTVDVKLAEVVKLLIKPLFEIFTYNYFYDKSHMKGSKLKISSL